MSLPGRISGIGLSTCLGNSYAETLAAYRTGKKTFERPRGIVGPDGTPPTLGQAIPMVEEFDLLRRFEQLLTHALDDLDAQCPGASTTATALFLLLPQWLRSSRMAPTVTRALEVAGRLPRQVLRVYDDETTFPELLAEGIAQAGTGTTLVAAVDSFVHAEMLDALAIQGRLLTRKTPNGIVAAEAAAVFRVGADVDVIPTVPAGLLLSVTTAREKLDRTRPEGLLGRALAGLWDEAGRQNPPDRLLLDMDGERWRGEEFGTAASAANLPDDIAADPETPPLTLGFTGCAGPAAAMGLALGAGPHPAQHATECSHVSLSWPDGRRTLAVLQRPVQPDEDVPAKPVSPNDVDNDETKPSTLTGSS